MIATSLLAGGCFHAQSYSPERSVATWREMQAPATVEVTTVTTRTVDAADALGVEEAVALALANDPGLAVAEARTEVAAAGVAVARQVDNPTLRLTNFPVDEMTRGRSGYNLGLRMPVPRPGSVQAKVQGARLGVDDAQAQAEAARREVRARVHRLYARLALLAADLEEVGRAAGLVDERRKQVRGRVEHAAATDVELALAEVAYAEAIDEAGRLRGELARTEAELARLVGAGPRRFRVDAELLAAGATEFDAGALIEQALRDRPELRAAQARVGQAQAQVALARSEATPWVSWAQVNYEVGPRAPVAALGFGLALDLPLFSWNLGKIRAAKALIRQRELEERASVKAVAGEVEEAAERVRRADDRVRTLAAGLVPQAEAAARQAEAALAAGALDPLKALDVEARRIAARRLHLAALYERREAIIALEAAVGRSGR